MRNWITLLVSAPLGAMLVHTSACQRHDGERPTVKMVATAAVPNPTAPVAPNAGSAVGHVLFSLLEAKLSSEPGAPPHTTARGTPALVVDERVVAAERWLRVISADGAYGWTPLSASATDRQARSAVVLSRNDSWILSDSATIDGAVERVSISARSGRVLGASDDPMVSRMEHLSVATRKNPQWLPWVRLQVREHVGFVPLFEHTVTWQRSPSRPAPAPPRGLVQRWALNTLPTPNSCPQELSRVESALGRVSLQRCDSEAWLAVTRPGAEPSRAVVDDDAAWILRYEEVDLNADGALDWALEVVSNASHGAGTELVLLLAGAAEAQRLPSEGQFSWQIERSDPPTLWVVSEGDLEARAYRMADGRLSATGGWVARSRVPQPHLHVQRVAFRDGAAVAYVEEPERFMEWLGFSQQPPGKIAARSDFAVVRVGPEGAVLAL